MAAAGLLLLFFLFPTGTLTAMGESETNVSDSESAADEEDLPSLRGGSRESGRVEVPEGHERAVFAGGCFWCMEPPYDEVDGVRAVTTGFTGGDAENPSYREVVGGSTGHVEAVEVVFDPSRVSYEELLDIFWMNIDPLDDGGQFCDRGSMYRSGIFFGNEDQQRLAEESKQELEQSDRFDREIATEIRELETFYPAEAEHQSYYTKNETRYRFYVTSCGRENRLEEVWG